MNAPSKPTIPAWAPLELLHAILAEQPAQRSDGVSANWGGPSYTYVGTNAAKLRGAYRKALNEAIQADKLDNGNRTLTLHAKGDADSLIERLLDGEIELPAFHPLSELHPSNRSKWDGERNAA